MSGLVLRLDDSQIDREFTRAIECYKTLGFVQSSLFGEADWPPPPPDHRVGSSPSHCSLCIGPLSLPIPGIDGFSAEISPFWPEPSLVFHDLDQPFPSRAERTSEWDGIIGWLLKIAEGSPSDVQERSSQRLGILHLRHSFMLRRSRGLDMLSGTP